MNRVRYRQARPLVQCLALLAIVATLVGGSQPAFRAHAARMRAQVVGYAAAASSAG